MLINTWYHFERSYLHIYILKQLQLWINYKMAEKFHVFADCKKIVGFIQFCYTKDTLTAEFNWILSAVKKLYGAPDGVNCSGVLTLIQTLSNAVQIANDDIEKLLKEAETLIEDCQSLLDRFHELAKRDNPEQYIIINSTV